MRSTIILGILSLFSTIGALPWQRRRGFDHVPVKRTMLIIFLYIAAPHDVAESGIYASLEAALEDELDEELHAEQIGAAIAATTVIVDGKPIAGTISRNTSANSTLNESGINIGLAGGTASTDDVIAEGIIAVDANGHWSLLGAASSATQVVSSVASSVATQNLTVPKAKAPRR